MKKITVISALGILLFMGCHHGQPDGDTLLNKAIAYHDPSGNWGKFRDSLRIRMETPESSPRLSRLFIDVPGQEFYARNTRDTITTEFRVGNGICELRLNGQTDFTVEEAAAHHLDCETAKFIKDYYTYLYGLPMKLKDPGTLVAKKVMEKSWEGKDYQVLEVHYSPEVGSDIWYFYFDPETYALSMYRFFHTDETGKVLPDSGEFIRLSGQHISGGIIIPAERAWFANKDSTYLGTDYLLD